MSFNMARLLLAVQLNVYETWGHMCFSWYDTDEINKKAVTACHLSCIRAERNHKKYLIFSSL